MEKIFLNVLTALGFTSYVGAILLNIGTWKADTLWVIAVLFGIAKFIRYSLKTWQDYREKELIIREHKNKIDKGVI